MHQIVSATLTAVSGMLLSWLLIPVIRAAAQKRGLNRAKQFHQTHSFPVCRFGGLALVLPFLVGACFLAFFPGQDLLSAPQQMAVVGSLAMFALGFWDDVRSLGAKKKLLFQIAIATTVYFGGLRVDQFKNPLTSVHYDLGLWGFFATVTWLVALTNLINLIDGIDGLAGGISLMVVGLLAFSGAATHAFSYYVALIMVGALLGFLYYNFPPASIYMGDGGAYFLGFLIGSLTIETSNKGTVAAALIAPMFALALPIVDVAIAILRRGLQGLPIFRPDRRHIHHRLMASGISKVKAVVILYAISLIFLVLAFCVFWSQARLVPFLFGAMCLVLLVAAGSIDFSRDWFSLGRVVGNSLEMRKETRYALILSQWMELEAERADKVEDLWEDYHFILRKLGYSKISMFLAGSQPPMVASLNSAGTFAEQCAKHDIGIGNVIAVELTSSEQLDTKKFDLMAELSAEIWVKALERWQTFHQVPVWFGPKPKLKDDDSSIKRSPSLSPA